MNWSHRLLRVKGIDIKVHLTFILLLAWAAYRWSAQSGEGLQGALFGVVATLLLFASVTLHELGHSFQALRYGVKVRDITLTPIGGLAQMEEIPEAPKQEFWIAVTGPLVNFGIAAVLITIGALLNARALVSFRELAASLGHVSWSGLLAYLATANLMLGTFNLIPAFPMDGGRILRVALAARMTHPRATRLAAQIGQGFAILMGLWALHSGSWTLALIAVFIWMSAGQESQGEHTRNILGGITVGQAMTRSPQALKVNDSLAKAVELTLSTSQADFPVLEWGNSRLAGLLTEADLVRGLHSLGAGAAVREAMRPAPAFTAPEEPLHGAQQKMLAHRTGALPVLSSGGELVGLLTRADINEAYRLLVASPRLALGTK